MSTALDPQTTDSIRLVGIDGYHFTGNDVTVQNKCKVIEYLRHKAVIYLSAQAAGVNKLTVYRWRDSDPQFAAAMAEAMEDAKEIMENSVYEDALNGNTLLKMFWLKRHDPNYRDKITIDVDSVKDEIQQRIAQLGVRELPEMTSEFIEVGGSQQATESLQFSPPLDDQQKERDE